MPFVIKCTNNEREQSVSELVNISDENDYIKDIIIDNIVDIIIDNVVDIVKQYFRKDKSRKE